MDKKFWENRWAKGQTGWDIGYPSTPLKTYFDQIQDKHSKILIPGCGNAYEAEYLHQSGFTQVHVVDIAVDPINRFKEKLPDFPSDHVHHMDFFDLKAKFDLIFEQTFFCALNPAMRHSYAVKMKDLLSENGKVVGVLFTFPLDDGPPFGGSIEEYEKLFNTYFDEVRIEDCYNSIPPRMGSEVFIQLAKK